MNFLTWDQLLELHRRIIAQSGGTLVVRDHDALASSLAQPFQTFGDEELYPTPERKAAALGFFLISNHPFLDGNKRIGHAALEITLLINGFDLSASVNDQEHVFLAVAAGETTREEFTAWVLEHTVPRV